MNTGYGCSGDEDDDGYWCDHGWWEFDLDRYRASLSGTMRIHPDGKSPTASGDTMKSGYGIQEEITLGSVPTRALPLREHRMQSPISRSFKIQGILASFRAYERVQRRFEFEEKSL